MQFNAGSAGGAGVVAGQAFLTTNAAAASAMLTFMLMVKGLCLRGVLDLWHSAPNNLCISQYSINSLYCHSCTNLGLTVWVTACAKQANQCAGALLNRQQTTVGWIQQVGAASPTTCTCNACVRAAGQVQTALYTSYAMYAFSGHWQRK